MDYIINGRVLHVDNFEENSTTFQLNYYQIEEVKYLTEIIKVHTNLMTLNLRGNFIKNKGTEYLAQILKETGSLTSFDLCENEIKEGVQFITEALKVNNSLTVLDLGYNKIGYKEI